MRGRPQQFIFKPSAFGIGGRIAAHVVEQFPDRHVEPALQQLNGIKARNAQRPLQVGDTVGGHAAPLGQPFLAVTALGTELAKAERKAII